MSKKWYTVQLQLSAKLDEDEIKTLRNDLLGVLRDDVKFNTSPTLDIKLKYDQDDE